jgi:hypothetical protein
LYDVAPSTAFQLISTSPETDDDAVAVNPVGADGTEVGSLSSVVVPPDVVDVPPDVDVPPEDVVPPVVDVPPDVVDVPPDVEVPPEVEASPDVVELDDSSPSVSILVPQADRLNDVNIPANSRPTALNRIFRLLRAFKVDTALSISRPPHFVAGFLVERFSLALRKNRVTRE